MPAQSQSAKALIASLRAVYDTVCEAAESFASEELVGADLAYLLGAMLKGTTCAWPANRPIIVLLMQSLPADHPVWGRVVIEADG
jgi:hypothetical protein